MLEKKHKLNICWKKNILLSILFLSIVSQKSFAQLKQTNSTGEDSVPSSAVSSLINSIMVINNFGASSKINYLGLPSGLDPALSGATLNIPNARESMNLFDLSSPWEDQLPNNSKSSTLEKNNQSSQQIPAGK